jgi:hypothetical protein
MSMADRVRSEDVDDENDYKTVRRQADHRMQDRL